MAGARFLGVCSEGTFRWIEMCLQGPRTPSGAGCERSARTTQIGSCRSAAYLRVEGCEGPSAALLLRGLACELLEFLLAHVGARLLAFALPLEFRAHEPALFLSLGRHDELLSPRELRDARLRAVLVGVVAAITVGRVVDHLQGVVHGASVLIGR